MTDTHADLTLGHDSGEVASDDSTSPVGVAHQLISNTPQGVQIQILQQSQGADHNPLNLQQSIFSQDIASAQIAFTNLPPQKQQEVLAACQQQLLHLSSSKQQEVLAACQQQLLQTLRTSIPSIVVPSAVQGVTVVGTNQTSQAGNIPGHYVTPFDTGSSQVITQPMSTTQQVAAVGSIPSTSGYEISQAQSLYTQQIAANHRAQQVNKLSTASPTTRACPEIIKWLLDNYETAEGVSLPRSTLYNHYLRHCAAKKIDAVNAASFGKLIRSLFIGLKTRRLGTRGSSKYHYYGIRIKPDSPLSTYLMDEGPSVAMRQPSTTQKEFHAGSDSGNGEGSLESQSGLAPHVQHQQYLGERRPELDQFPYPEWEGQRLPEDISHDDLTEFIALYREHCEAILDVVTNLQFQMVENLWQLFWGDNSKSSTSDVHSDDDGDHRMPPEKLMALTMFQPLMDYVVSCDHILYQCIVDFLIPSVLRSIPATLTQAIRNFAKSLEGWMKTSMQSYPQSCVQAKVSSVIAFSQTLRRYTSLNHLAQAARAVLQNSSQINQMVTDLNRVDFSNVQEQASWVCQCDESVVLRLEHDFKTTLQQQKSLEQWAVWMEEVVDTILQPFKDTEDYPKAARQFLLKWSFYSSMVIRDLTLRSAASFGSFHLIRLLYDEYMFYLIEHKVAKASGKTPIAVMTEFSNMAKLGFDLVASATPTEQSELSLETFSRKRMSRHSSDPEFDSQAKKAPV